MHRLEEVTLRLGDHLIADIAGGHAAEKGRLVLWPARLPAPCAAKVTCSAARSAGSTTGMCVATNRMSTKSLTRVLSPHCAA
jgi:hypothetical protein